MRPLSVDAAPQAPVLRALAADPGQKYFLFKPRSAGANPPVVVLIHGISRNAAELISAFAGPARGHGVLLIVPLFGERRHRHYQRLIQRGAAPRADQSLNMILDEVQQSIGADTRRVCLFGYSGGAQFAHRYLMAYPQRVGAGAIAAAGWYTFPDSRRRFPYGIGAADQLPGVQFVAEDFLQVPVHVWVGALDIKCDSGLRRSRRVDEQQGQNRVERAERWVSAMRAAASRLGFDTRYDLTVLPHSDHSFTRSVSRDRLPERVLEALFAGRGLNVNDALSTVNPPERQTG